MKRLMLTLVFVSFMWFASIPYPKVQAVDVSTNVYIRANGSIDPQTAPISTTDNITYTFTGNITFTDIRRIAIERSNIVIDGNGYTFRGASTGGGAGLWINNTNNVNNVTIKNLNIQNFYIGVALGNSSNNIIHGNNITDNNIGVELNTFSKFNSIYGNNMTRNFNSGISLQGASNNTISSNSFRNSGAGIVLSEGSDNNTISGNTIMDNNWGISVESSTHNTISGNTLNNNSLYGFNIAGYSNFNSISENDVIDSDEGIRLYEFTAYNTISENNISYNTDGVTLYRSSSNDFVGNTFTNNTANAIILDSSSDWNNILQNTMAYSSIGINARNSQYLTISANNITGCTDDSNGAIEFDACSNSIIQGNEITFNIGSGIYFYSSSNNNEISGNRVTNNGYFGIALTTTSNFNNITGNDASYNYNAGVYLESCSNNIVVANNLASNYHGVWLTEESNTNQIFHNNFVNSLTENAFVSASSTDNLWDNGYPSGGNYWSDYVGLDVNHDGIGDVPYIVDLLNQDHYPLVDLYPTIPEFSPIMLLSLLLLASVFLAVLLRKSKSPVGVRE